MSDAFVTKPTEEGLEIRVLGPIEIRSGGSSIHLGSGKQRTILALMASRPNQVISNSDIALELWGEAPPPSSSTAIRVHIAGLRTALAKTNGDCAVEQQTPGYLLRIDPLRIDAQRFVSAVEHQPPSVDHRSDFLRLSEAIGLWRGEPFDGADSDTLANEATHLRRLLVDATELRFDRALELGHHAHEVEAISRATAAHPYRERLVGQLMLALYRCGRQAEALREFETARIRLRDELGVAPGHELAALHHQILNHEVMAVEAEPRTMGSGLRLNNWTIACPTSAQVLGGPLFGRETECRSIDSQLSSVVGREPGRILMISGPPGIGKSRLNEYIAERAVADGVTVLHGWFSEYQGCTFEAIGEVLRQVFGEVPDHILRNELANAANILECIVPAISFRLGRNSASHPAASQISVFEAIHDTIAFCAARNPLAIILDDLHWADSESLQLLRFLGRRGLPPGSILVIASRIRVELGGLLTLVMEELERLDRTVSLELKGLSLDHVQHFVRGLDRPQSSELNMITSNVDASKRQKRFSERTHELLDITGGNPLFLRALAPLSEDSPLTGDRTFSEDKTRLRSLVAAALEPQLRTLADSSKDVLRHAAALGTEFGPEALEHLGLDWEVVSQGIEDGIEADILLKTSGSIDPFRFRHDLWRELLYGQLSSRDRTTIHASAATFFADSGPSRILDASRHSCLGVPVVDPVLAVQRSLDAARASIKALGFETGAQTIERALELERQRPGSFRDVEPRAILVDAKCLAAQLRLLTAHHEAAKRWQTEAMSDARSIRDFDRLVAAALGATTQGTTVVRNPDRIAVLESTLLELPVDERFLRHRVQSWLAMELHADPDWQRGRDLAGEAVAGLRTFDDQLAFLDSIWVFARFCNGDPDAQRLKVLSDEVRSIALALDNPVALLSAGDLSVMTHLRCGDLSGVRRALADYNKAVSMHPRPWDLWLCCAMTASTELLFGNREIALTQMGEALNIGSKFEMTEHLGAYVAQRFLDSVFDGDASALIEETRLAIAFYPDIPAWKSALALALVCSDGTSDEAAALARDAVSQLETGSRVNYWLVGVALASEYAIRTNDLAVARRVVDLFEPYSNQLVTLSLGYASLGSVDHYAGIAHMVCGEHAEAEVRLQRSIDWSVSTAARTCEMDSRIRFAQNALLGGFPFALENIQRGLGLAEELGYLRRTNDAKKILTSIQEQSATPNTKAKQ